MCWLRASGSCAKEGRISWLSRKVMQAAGLNHGFYLYFRSRDEFMAEALEALFRQTFERARPLFEGLAPAPALATFVDFYVSPRQRDSTVDACPVVTLASDLPRQSPKFQAVFETGVKQMITGLAQWIAALGAPEPEKLAASVLSAMAGAVSLARAVSDKQLSDDLLEAARANIKARLGVSDADLCRGAHLRAVA